MRPANPGDHERWKSCAQNRNMSFNRWALQALNSQADLEEAEARERSEQIAERERLHKAAFPQKQGKCRHVKVGEYCYTCAEKRWA